MKRFALTLTASTTTFLVASPAAAQQGLEKFTNLASTAATFIQAICLIACVAFIAMAGVAMAKGDPSANEKVSMGVKGTAVAAGALIIVEFIKQALL